MCKIVDDYAKKLAKAQAKEFAFKLWKKGYRDLNEIAEMTELPLDEVKEMFKGESA